MRVNDIVQFNENHKWAGCLGIITEIKEIHNNELQADGYNDFRYMIAVPIPQQGTAYIYVLASEFAIEMVGVAVLTPRKEDSDE